MNILRPATHVLCLMSRIDYESLSEDRKEEIKPFYDAFQDSFQSARLISGDNGGTSIEILVLNSLVPEANKLLWYGIHDLVSPGNYAYIEIHNFDANNNTIDIEKYLIDSIIITTVKHSDSVGPQTIKITGGISKEITIQDKVE